MKEVHVETVSAYDYLLEEDSRRYCYEDIAVHVVSTDTFAKIFDTTIQELYNPFDRHCWHRHYFNHYDQGAIAVKECFYYNDSVYGNISSWTIYAESLDKAMQLIKKYKLRVSLNQNW